MKFRIGNNYKIVDTDHPLCDFNDIAFMRQYLNPAESDEIINRIRNDDDAFWVKPFIHLGTWNKWNPIYKDEINQVFKRLEWVSVVKRTPLVFSEEVKKVDETCYEVELTRGTDFVCNINVVGAVTASLIFNHDTECELRYVDGRHLFDSWLPMCVLLYDRARVRFVPKYPKKPELVQLWGDGVIANRELRYSTAHQWQFVMPYNECNIVFERAQTGSTAVRFDYGEPLKRLIESRKC